MGIHFKNSKLLLAFTQECVLKIKRDCAPPKAVHFTQRPYLKGI